MAYYSSEVIQKVKELDLLSYLQNYEPEELVNVSKNTFTTKTHDSLVISNGLWHWFSRGIGGKSALDYLIKVKGYEFTKAMEMLLNKGAKVTSISLENKKKDSRMRDMRLILPKKADNNDKIISYLLGRGIDKDIIEECIDNELIFQDENNNIIFVGVDKNNKARYAFTRGTNESRFMHDCYGSHKAFSFRLDSIEDSDTVHLFESSIDLLSYATLMKIDRKPWYNENLLSLSGVYRPASKIEESKIPLSLNYYLNQHPNIKKIVLHLDNDSVGRISTLALKTILSKRYEIIDDPPKIGKDVNDLLCSRLKINYKKRYERER